MHSTADLCILLIVQEEPPAEVLEELGMIESKDLAPAPSEHEDGLGAAGPLFRRIVLGNGCEVPLTMARDILEVLHEDGHVEG